MKTTLGLLCILIPLCGVLLSGCGGSGGSNDADSRLRWVQPYDGEVNVNRDRDVTFALTHTPRLLTTGLFYWLEDTDQDGKVDYPDEVEGTETTFHYNDLTKEGSIETMYRMYADTVYLVILEVNDIDYSITFTTEPERGMRSARPHTPSGIDLDPNALTAKPKILHVVAP